MNTLSRFWMWALVSALVWGCGGKSVASREDGTSGPVPNDGGRSSMTDVPSQPRPMGGRASTPPIDDVSMSGQGGDGAGAVGDESAAGAGGQAWSIPYCEGAATTQIVIEVNLGSLDQAIDTALNPWDPNDAPNTANFSTTMLAYDGLGRAHTIDVYFRKSDTFVRYWEYHVLRESIELGRGSVRFDELGGFADQHIEQILSLPLPSPDAPELKLVLDPSTSLPGQTNVYGQWLDGKERRWGYRCSKRPHSDPPPRVLGVAICESHASLRMSLLGSLTPTSPIASLSWDPLNPIGTSTLHTDAWAVDEESAVVPYALYFRRETADGWSVHAQLGGEQPGIELGDGRFAFDPSGSIIEHGSIRIELPSRSGAAPRYLLLDMASRFDDAGNRVSGVVLEGSSSGVYQVADDPPAIDCRRRVPQGSLESL